MRSTVRWQWRIILSLALALTALSLPGRAQSPLALVHVRIDSISDLTRVDASGMPILAHLTGSNGDYLLARLSPDAQRQLASMGFAVSVLDANATGATYYLLESPRLGAVSDTPLTIIWDDGRYAVGRLRQGVSAQSVDDIDTPKMELGPDPIVLLARASAAIPTTVTYDPLVARLLAQVTSDSVYAYAGGLSGAWPVSIGGAPYTLTTRYTYSGTPIAKATQYVYEHLQARGYTTSYHYYTLSGNTLRNVIGEKTGQTHPDQIVLLTAHLDSRAASAPHDPAPGADDNASGATALLIAADLLADLEFEYTVRVVFFTGEEQGMLGSYDYAAAVYSAGDDILGVINLDMIAWDAKYGPDIDLHSNTPSIFNDSDRLAQVFVSSIGVYGLNLTPQIVDNGARFSDHSRFWDRGYPAIMAIEDYYNASEVAAEPRDWNTNYHTDKDTVGTLNLTYFREYARAGLATFAHLARPMRTISGAITSSVGEVVDGATVVAAGTTGTFQTMTDSAGRYALQVPAGTYSISASAPNYLSQTVTGVVVETGEGTRRDFVLGQVQRFTVHGAVSDAQSGVGLAAVLQFGAGPTVSTTNGEYNVELVSGTHPVTVTAPYHHPVVDSVVVDQDQRRDFALEPTACILVVDDDFDNLGNRFDDQVFYTSTLDALRVGHDVWTVPDDANGPPFDVLTLYRGVIWLTGRDWDATITSVDQAALGAYLDGGGNLFLSGQDVGYDIGRSSSPAPFYSSYLRAAYGLDDSGSRTLAGEGILAGINVMIEEGDGANNQQYPSAVDVVGDGAPAFRYDTGRVGAITVDNGVHRIVYFAFGFEAINDAAQRRAVMHRVLDFLNPCDIPAQYGIGAPGLIVGFGEPGETVTHTVPISNRGLLSDAYSLSMSQPVWTTTLLITATPGISAGTQFTVPVVTLIPGSAIVGAGDTVTLTVTSVQSPTHTARVVIHTAIGRRVYVPQVLRRWSPLTSDWTG